MFACEIRKSHPTSSNSPPRPSMTTQCFNCAGWFGFQVWCFWCKVQGVEFGGGRFGFRAADFGSGLWGSGVRVSGPKFQVPGSRFKVSGVWFQVSGFRFKVSGIRFQVPGFRFQFSGFRLQVSGFGGENTAFTASASVRTSVTSGAWGCGCPCARFRVSGSKS